MADACNIGCNKIYNDTFGWINNGVSEPTLYITTELELSEVQTGMIAFLSNVNEEHILNGKYVGDEEERVLTAAQILKDSQVYVEELPDFSITDVENSIRKNIRDHDVKYVFFDYLNTSMKIIEEVSRKSNGTKLREDTVLYMLAIKLKDLCNEYGIFILTSTQLNANYVDAEEPDQNLLRGAKSIADKADVGAIMLEVKETDREKLRPILEKGLFEVPKMKLSIYKNRRGRYKGIFLWCKADLGVCRVEPMFATTYQYELLDLKDLKIIVNEEESAF